MSTTVECKVGNGCELKDSEGGMEGKLMTLKRVEWIELCLNITNCFLIFLSH